jgi:hypothetical protein
VVVAAAAAAAADMPVYVGAWRWDRQRQPGAEAEAEAEAGVAAGVSGIAGSGKNPFSGLTARSAYLRKSRSAVGIAASEGWLPWGEDGGRVFFDCCVAIIVFELETEGGLYMSSWQNREFKTTFSPFRILDRESGLCSRIPRSASGLYRTAAAMANSWVL